MASIYLNKFFCKHNDFNANYFSHRIILATFIFFTFLIFHSFIAFANPPFSEGDCVYIWAASASEPMQDYTSTSDQNLITDISHDASGSLVYSTTTLPAGQVAGKNYVLSTGVNSTCQCNTLPQFDYWSCIPQYFSWSLI